MRLRLLLLIAVMLVCYLLPWVINPGVSLTLGGYDLGEWTSLLDAVRGEQPPLLTSFLLRLPLALFALMISFAALTPPLLFRRGGWGVRSSLGGEAISLKILKIVLILLITTALLPPLEILDTPNDPNYRQQVLLSMIALIGGMIGISGGLRRFHRLISIGICVVGVLAILIGLTNAINLMRGFGLPVTLGAGGIFLSLLFALNAVLMGLEARRSFLPSPVSERGWG